MVEVGGGGWTKVQQGDRMESTSSPPFDEAGYASLVQRLH